MKIAYLGAGAGGRICGACFHDNGLATALRARGQDILLIPTFTPIRTDEENVSHSRVFFGGLNVYLQQNFALFRHTPWFLDRLFDTPALLNWLTARSSNTQASDLGELTVSTLQGTDGRQRKEIAKLIAWLQQDFQPDVIHLSNVLLAGLAAPLRAALNVPIVAGLMGEDIFLEQLHEPHYSQARALLKQKSAAIERFTALNHYYADLMSEYLEVPRERIQVIRHGLNLTGHEPRSWATIPSEITLGFFARLAAEKGLHQLIEALALLQGEPNLPRYRLRVAGYMSGGDQPYVDRIKQRVHELQLTDRVEFLGEVDRQQKMAFLQTIDLMVVPTVYHESKGISVLEAMASGVPVLVPQHGTFPEYIQATGGGVLCASDNPAALAQSITELLRSPQRLPALGHAGAAAIRQQFTASHMAAEHEALYESLVKPS